MHPVLRQLKGARPTADSQGHSSAPVTETAEGDGVARLPCSVDHHPRAQLKKDSSEALVPRQNVFRDFEGQEQEEIRDLKYRSGRMLDVDKHKYLTDEDFELDRSVGISRGRMQMAAADLVSSYQQTAREEANFQSTFNNTVRTLIARDEVVVGLMHLWDFTEAYVTNPNSRSLTAQLLLIGQHIRQDGIFRETMLNISEPESKWLLDLINILHSIIVQERGLQISEKVAAINYSVITLGKFYARKIFNSPFVPLDKEVKIDTFYMRMVVKVLVLCDDLGIYRNEKIQKVVSSSRRRELTDAELMYSLRRALATSGNDEIAEDRNTSGEFEWYPRGRLCSIPEEMEEDLNPPSSQYYSTQNVAVPNQPCSASQPAEQTGCGRRVARRV